MANYLGIGNLGAVHQQIQDIAAEFHLTTDDVVFVMGLESKDVGVHSDPNLAERIKRLSAKMPNVQTLARVRDAVVILLHGITFIFGAPGDIEEKG